MRKQKVLSVKRGLNNLFMLSFIVLILSACKKDKTPVPPIVDTSITSNVKVVPFYGSESLVLDSTFTFSNGTKIQFTDIKFYISDFSVGSFSNSIALFDFRTTGNSLFSTKENTENGNLSMNLGVSASQNHADPSAFANDNPLNIAIANDMHWSWSPGYIFLKIEARVDTIPDGVTNFSHYLVYHIGKDENFSGLNFPNANWTALSANSKELKLKLDLKQIFENSVSPVNLSTEYTSHTNASQVLVTDKIRQNFLSSLTLL